MRSSVWRPVGRLNIKFDVWAVAAGALAMMLLGGCATSIPQALNARLIPPSLSSKPDGQEPHGPAGWWNELGSSELSALVDEANAGNLDLAAADARILEAQAQLRVQRAAFSPQFGLSAQGQRAKRGNIQPGGSFGSGTQNSFAISMSASYEADLFGLNRSNARAAGESLKASRFARQSMSLNLTASVANTYFAYSHCASASKSPSRTSVRSARS